MILEGVLKEGDPTALGPQRRRGLPPESAHGCSRATSNSFDEQLWEKRRGLALFVSSGARQGADEDERQRFLEEDWPK